MNRQSNIFCFYAIVWGGEPLVILNTVSSDLLNLPQSCLRLCKLCRPHLHLLRALNEEWALKENPGQSQGPHMHCYFSPLPLCACFVLVV